MGIDGLFFERIIDGLFKLVVAGTIISISLIVTAFVLGAFLF